MRKYITLFFSATLFLFSCKEAKGPNGVINHDQMVSLLTEVHVVDGRTYGVNQSQDSLTKYGTARFDAVFKRFNTDSSEFIRSLKYYSTQPAELQKMYEQIMTNLKKKTDSLNYKQHVADSLRRLQMQKNNNNALPQ